MLAEMHISKNGGLYFPLLYLVVVGLLKFRQKNHEKIFTKITIIFYTLHCAAAKEIGRKSLYIDAVKLPALQTNVGCKA